MESTPRCSSSTTTFTDYDSELLFESDTREALFESRFRVASTRVDIEIECWIHDGETATTDLFSFGRLDHSHPTSNAANSLRRLLFSGEDVMFSGEDVNRLHLTRIRTALGQSRR